MNSEPLAKEPTKDANPFRLELRLEPTQSGLRELKNWPAANFSPNFAAATRGAVRIELAGQLLGGRDGKVLAVERRLALRLEQDINFWLLDFLGGFALNLGKALQTLQGGARQSVAGFIDEPLTLAFARVPRLLPAKIVVGFEADGVQVRQTELPEATLYAEVRRALQDFRRQLLDLNPELARQPDVLELTHYIQKLV